jgi:flagellar motility protein MotE (MotC chaperone)
MEENRRKKPQVLPKSEDPQSQHNNMWQVVLPSKEPDKAIHPTWPDQEKPHNSAEKPLNSEELYSEVAEHFQKAEKQRELDEKLRDQEAKIKEFSVIEAKKKHTQQNIEMHAKHMAEKRRQAPQDLHDKRTEYRALLRHERDKAIHQMWPEL